MSSETLRSGGQPDRLAAAPPISYADTAASTRSQGRRRTLPGGRTTTILLAAAAAFAGTALIVNWQARRAERRHPSEGEFITVNGVRLHYIEAGEGSPAEADRDRKGYDDRLAELTRAAKDSERQLQREQTARSEAQAERERLRGALKRAETERTAAQKDVERLQHELTEALAQAKRDRNDYEARLAAVNRRRAEREEGASTRESSLNASQSAGRAKSRTRATNAGVAIVASDAAGPAATSIEPAAHGLEIHFKKPADWAETVFVYCWDTDPATEKLPWPGVPLAAQENGWFVHWFSQLRSAHLVFNDNAGKQTQNLYRDRSGWLDADGTWHDEPGTLP